MDILKYNSFKVQKNTSLNTLKCSRFLDVLKSNYGYPKIEFGVFRRTWTDTEELLKEKSFFILSFVFLSEFVIRQVQTNIC